MIMNRHKLKFALAQNDSGVWTDQFDDDGIIVLRSTEQTVDGGWRIEAPARLRFDYVLPEEQFLKRGDIVITKSSGSSLHIGKASLVNDSIEAMHCTFSNFMQRLRCKPSCEPRFVWYYLNSVAGRNELDRASNTTTGLANLNGTLIGNLEISFPPISTQRRIAAYLDEQTAKIDRLIDKRQQQIGLLKEQRAALIQHAVTRGLNPNVKMKDSGIAWLGEVPGHWEITTLKWLATLQRGYDLPEQNRIEGDVPVVTSGGIVATHNQAMAKAPGVVTGRYGSTGIIFYLEQDYWPHNTALFVKDFHGNLPQYVYYALQTLNYEIHSAKSAVPGVDRKDLHETIVVVPPLPEQEKIVEQIDSVNRKIDHLAEKIACQIALLQEYRASLIHECVTGEREGIANGLENG